MERTLPTSKLMTFEFSALCLVMGAAFCNTSVFYSFYHYLGTIGIPVTWRGFLVGLEPMSAFALRLLIIPWLNVRNALSITLASLALLIVASCSYIWATTISGLIILRVFHGAVFVLLTSAVVALAVHFIPQDRSGQGFSILTVASIVPYAVMPSLTEALLPHVRSEADIYASVSIFSLIAIGLLAPLRKRFAQRTKGADTSLTGRLRLDEIQADLRQGPIFCLLAASFLVYLTHATFFYFMKSLSLQIRTGDVGLFFSVSMVAMLAVRLAGGMAFDRVNKLSALRKILALLVLCVFLTANVSSETGYYLLAGFYGLCLGSILPLLNALLFSASPPAFRGLNTNLGLSVMDMAYFMMPYLGSAVIALKADFRLLFYLAAGFAAMAWGFARGTPRTR